MPLVTKRKVSFLAKKEYFTTGGVHGLLTKLFFLSLGHVPIDRESSSAAHAALETGKKILESGGVIGIHPEGTRSPDGYLHRGKTGAARLALACDAPIVPVALLNTDTIQPIGKIIPKIRRVRMVVGKPIYPSAYRKIESERQQLRDLTDDVMKELARLSGRTYVDTYAVRKKG